MSNINLDAVAENLGVEVSQAKVETKKLSIQVTQMTASFRVSVKNTYSSAEFSQTVDIANATKEQLDKFKIDFINATSDKAIEAAELLVYKMQQKNLV